MKLKYIISVVFITPLIGLIIANYLTLNLSAFQINSINVVCSAILVIALIDVLFIAFKRYKNINQ